MSTDNHTEPERHTDRIPLSGFDRLTGTPATEQQRLDADTDASTTATATIGGGGLAQVAAFADSVKEREDQYESAEEEIRTLYRRVRDGELSVEEYGGGR